MEEKEITRNHYVEKKKTKGLLKEDILSKSEVDLLPEQIHQIFDKVFKKILTLSNRSIIHLINGLYGTNYSYESKVEYNWTEFQDEDLKRILADTILTIDSKYAYHLEAQIEKDNCIVFRVFEYGFGHANRTRLMKNGKCILTFPRPVVIYLYYEGEVPDEYELELQFEDRRSVYKYKVPTLKLPELTAKELSERQLVLLIPFHILKLRSVLKNRNVRGLTEEEKKKDLEELQTYILHDIIAHIDENLRLNNITREDAMKLKRYLRKLCSYLGNHYEELEVIKDMTDESFMTDVDIFFEEFHKKVDEMDAQIAKKEEQIAEKEEQIAEKEELIAEKDAQLRSAAQALVDKGVDMQEVYAITGVLLEVIE